MVVDLGCWGECVVPKRAAFPEIFAIREVKTREICLSVLGFEAGVCPSRVLCATGRD